MKIKIKEVYEYVIDIDIEDDEEVGDVIANETENIRQMSQELFDKISSQPTYFTDYDYEVIEEN